MNETDKVKDFFQRRVGKFDAYYSEDKSLFWKLLDYVFRRSMHQRLVRTLEEVAGVKDPAVLDIGCGPGRYSVAATQVGAISAVGIDFSAQMLGRARQIARESGVEGKCQFVYGEFLEYPFAEKFDITIAVGLFDYIENPVAYLNKIRGLTLRKAIMSFPSRWHLRNIIRIIRLLTLGCPVHFYDRGKIAKLLKMSNFKDFRIESLDRDYFVVAEVK